jgi:hypothetical protein
MSPFPNTTIPTLPPVGTYCLVRVDKVFKGKRAVDFQTPYKCGREKPLETHKGILKLKLELGSAGAPCDENPPLIPDGSILTASGVVIRRVDGLADFTSSGRGGLFVIRAPDGTILFTGFIELMDRVGSHGKPVGPEPCDLEKHVEGWLVGTGKGKLDGTCLRVLLVANGFLDLKEATPIEGRLNGVLVKPSDW